MNPMTRRILGYLRAHKCYICFIAIWFGLTYVMLSDYISQDWSKSPTEPRTGPTNNGCNCVCNTSARHAKLQGPVDYETKKPVKLVLSVVEFMTKAREDPLFLENVLDQAFLHRHSKDVIRSYLTGERYRGFDQDLTYKVPRQANYSVLRDTIVFLHIQKTGGRYFNERLRTLKLPFPCNCDIIPCLACRPDNGTVWMYASDVTGWPCGLHADWTQLHRCLPGMVDTLEGKHRKRRYFYITQLRNPIERYLSEWKHQNRGSHWQDAVLGCREGVAGWSDVRPCFIGESWKGVSLDNFIACPHNLATNRQARMLADLNLTDCYQQFTKYDMKVKRAHVWVKSAVDNLKRMSYFGLMEEPDLSDRLFEATFGLGLGKRYALVKQRSPSVTEDQFIKILRLVELDIYVYMFAKELFNRRAYILDLQRNL